MEDVVGIDCGISCHYRNGDYPSRIDGIEGIYGNNYIVKCPVDYTSDPYEYRYLLFDGNSKDNEKYFNCLSDTYKDMSTTDGKIYLVQTEDDKWGFIDADGKELGIFDEAGAFTGKYAPVVKNGKAYLVDRNMNRVSDKIDADSVRSLPYSSDMFVLTKDGEDYLATFAADSSETDTSEPTSEPTDEPTDEPTSEPTSSETSAPDSETSDSDNSNPTTGAAGICLIAVPAAICGAAVIVCKKKRK